MNANISHTFIAFAYSKTSLAQSVDYLRVRRSMFVAQAHHAESLASPIGSGGLSVSMQSNMNSIIYEPVSNFRRNRVLRLRKSIV